MVQSPLTLSLGERGPKTSITQHYPAGEGPNSTALASDLARQLGTLDPDQPIPVLIELRGKARLDSVTDRTRAARRVKVAQRLKAHAQSREQAWRKTLQKLGASDIHPYWINHSIAASVPARAVRRLARLPGVARLRADHEIGSIDRPAGLATTAVNDLPTSEWNLEAMHAPDMWLAGVTGQGAVVAGMDSGADANHPDLAGGYRGGANSWHDTSGQHTNPIDTAGPSLTGHGTRTLGLMVGGNGDGSYLGVAPDAQWIAVKVFDNQGKASLSDFIAGFQWLLDPDENPLTDDAPDVVNGSFQITSGFDVCDTALEDSIQSLKTAGIAVVFAAGNSGPTPASSVSPANNPSGFSVGSVDADLTVAPSSSRGPSTCTGAIFPHVTAPGEGVKTTDISLAGIGSYATVSGTSFAAPQVAGALALLSQAFPAATVSDLENALMDSATDLGNPGPDQDYGYGLINVAAAHDRLLNGQSYPRAVVDSYELNEDHTLTIAAPGILGNDFSPLALPLSAQLVGDVRHGTLSLQPDGAFTYTPATDYAGTDSFSYRASDGSHDSGMTVVTLRVDPVNDAPVAVADTVSRANIGHDTVIRVQANDYDPEGAPLTTVIDTQPGHGSLSINPDGSVTYHHNGTTAEADAFSYHVNDGELDSATVTVSIDVSNAAPTITSTPAPTARAGSAYTYEIDASDANLSDIPPDTLTYSLVAGPAGVLVGADTGLLTWTPTNGQGGVREITVRVTDSGGLSDEQSFAITVGSETDTPPIALPDLFLFKPGQARTIAAPGVLANDQDADQDPLTAIRVSGNTGPALSESGAVSYLSSRSRPVQFRYRAHDGSAMSEPVRGTTARLAADAAPTARADNCILRGNQTVSPAERCGLQAGTVVMDLAANDTDPNQHRNVPTDGIGMTVVRASLQIGTVGIGVTVPANPACGQPALGISPATRAVLENGCDGTVKISITPGNTRQPVNFGYRISDDLQVASRLRPVTLTLKP